VRSSGYICIQMCVAVANQLLCVFTVARYVVVTNSTSRASSKWQQSWQLP
jgi:hypothetical protein